MKKRDEIKNEVDKTLDAIGQINRVQAPDGIHDAVMNKLVKNEELGTDYAPYMRWAAIGLLVLMNTASYISFLNEENTEQQILSESEVEIENLVSEYQMTDFTYDEY